MRELYAVGRTRALRVAAKRARETGQRYRVQRARWLPRDWNMWFGAPTPAPAPAGRIGAEPCS